MDDALFAWLGIGGQVHCLEGLIPAIWPTTGMFIASHLKDTDPQHTPSEFSMAMAAIREVKQPSAVSVTIPLAVTGDESVFVPVINRLCRDSWGFVSAWKQSCEYSFSVPYAKTMQDLQSNKDPLPFQARTTVTSDLTGIKTHHEDVLFDQKLTFGATESAGTTTTTTTPARLVSFRQQPRRPWSTKEDAANTLSDVFMSHVGISQLGRGFSTGPSVGIDMNCVRMARDSLAAKGMAVSEHWSSHEHILHDVEAAASCSSASASCPPLVLQAINTRPIPPATLPQVANPTQVAMSFKKTFTSSAGSVPLFTSEWSTLLQSRQMFELPIDWKITLATTSTHANYSESERALFATFGERLGGVTAATAAAAGGRGNAGVVSSVQVEITNASALIKDGANPLWLAIRLWIGALGIVGLDKVRLNSLNNTAIPCYANLWRSGFLCRVWRSVNQETLTHRWLAAKMTASDLSNDRLFAKHQDILRHWGPLFDTGNKDTATTSAEKLNLSGAMPRLYRAAPLTRYVQRPKLVLVKQPISWSWG